MLAHSRRQRENDTFMDIAQALPVHENAKDLDKASILRLAIHYLKLRDLIRDGNDEEEEREELEEGREETEDQGDIIKGGMTSPKSPLSTSSTLSIPSKSSDRNLVFGPYPYSSLVHKFQILLFPNVVALINH